MTPLGAETSVPAGMVIPLENVNGRIARRFTVTRIDSALVTEVQPRE